MRSRSGKIVLRVSAANKDPVESCIGGGVTRIGQRNGLKAVFYRLLPYMITAVIM
jgi:hypothetical protein